MSSKTIVCAACNAAVPYGRLSCPSCGELLASVAGAARPMMSATVVGAPAPAWDPPPAPSAIADVMPVDDEPLWPDPRLDTPAVSRVATPLASDAPGAYVPPLAPALPPAAPALPAGAPALARAWAGHPTGQATAPDPAAGARASAAALVDGARMPEFIDWLAVAGSALAAIGFVLPWGISVIGASGVDYFDRWGLAGPFHPIVVLALLAVLGLALIRNPIPLWVRVGLPGLGVGALLLGLVWPYLVGLPGMGPGALVVAVGAIVLTSDGIMALAADRHGPLDHAG